MPTLITADAIKEQLPLWQTYCTRQDALKTPDQMLDIAIDNAEKEFTAHFRTLVLADMTDSLTFHLARIAKYNCFNYLHGDTMFKKDPQIVTDYKDTRTKLDKNLLSKGTGSENVVMTSKERVFGADDKWFLDGKDISST